MSGERTEKPTARRLRDARRKGQVARSRDLGQALSLLACVLVLSWTGSAMARALGGEIKRALVRMGDTPLVAVGPKEVAVLAIEATSTLAMVCGPVAFASMLAVIGVQAAQGGFTLSSQALAADWSRLSPATGFKRLGFSQGGIETLKAVLVSTTLVVIGYLGIKAVVGTSPALSRVGAVPAAAAGWSELLALLRQTGIALLVFAAADYGVQRWRFMKSQRMTKQEVRDDYKLTEGNPEIKGRVRRIQMEMVRRRMFAAVPKATVVVTNPTHFAVALEYHRGAMAAPRVLAKGRNLIAQRIRTIAREHGVPVVENPPLARALYQSVEIGDFIPGALFEAVAEVLAYLIRLRQLVL